MALVTFDPTAIKAIPTTYNNLTFRSRLEARWAVVMDALHVKYEYEPEGYERDGVRYLCDFYLPDLGSWVEIKPTRESVDEVARKKALMLCHGLRQPVFVFSGPCDVPVYTETDVQSGAYGFFPEHGAPEHARYAFGKCIRCQQVRICGSPEIYCGCNESSLLNATRSIWIHTAFAIAKSVKFEQQQALTARSVQCAATWAWTETLNHLGDSQGYPVGMFIPGFINRMV